ncbi:hypothetical protein J2X65_002040 [Ancylobacter sp. 3268]|nr:hypothetical protein [Ancylobacter sp. 3268]MDR6952681.1 hypothetical protein [Ancylobacter sp. 3268]
MIRRGWPPADIFAMTASEFAFHLQVAVEDAKAEAEAMKQAGKSR